MSLADLPAYIPLHQAAEQYALPVEVLAPADNTIKTILFHHMLAVDVQRVITEAAQRAGITKKVTPHTLRHTFATRFLQQGGDLATLAKLIHA